ncbi:hypothetical protein M422DRAFT_24731 [Sphaerobolus stellatus SS14]|nr:hypothetical protein M422DRAFT_24731 [Sphaerobolus stellatus SS14]
MSHEIDEKIQDIYKRIQTERKVIEASEMMRLATSNQDVIRRTDTQIRAAQRSLSYFETTLRELQTRKLQSQQAEASRQGGSSSQGGTPTSTRGPWGDQGDRGGNGGWEGGGPDVSPVQDTTPKAKNYTNLDLVKADTPLTTAKISRMLHQLEFKLQVEGQYKDGIDKMARLYQADLDKKSRQDPETKRIESRRIESETKLQLLQQALKQYKNLHILDYEEQEEEEVTDDAQRGGKKPVSGKLQISIKGARDLDHAPVVRGGRHYKPINETTVTVKVEGTHRARTHPSRTDRWMEDFELAVDKANEIEITVYDKQVGAEHPVPIGLLWVNISDIVDSIRKAKVHEEGKGGGWVTAAGAMREGSYPGGPDPGFGSHSGLGGPSFGGMPGGDPFASPEMLQQHADGIDAWFAVEPAGAIALRLNFVKENVRKRPLDAGGLGRQGAVRKRKGEVHEMNGHKFVQKQFYQIILCAFCNEFLLNALGYQCEDCRYTCHKRCYEKVVTKCISKSTNDLDRDEVKINHRIPHRFTSITNIGANWCCHCGYMLPLGRKNARKCSECDLTCHASCAHLVPDFCGMPMETANQLLAQLRAIESRRKPQPAIPHEHKHLQLLPPPPSNEPPQVERITEGLEQARITAVPEPPYEQQRPISQGMYQAQAPPPLMPPGYDQRYSQPPPVSKPGAKQPQLPQGPTPPYSQDGQQAPSPAQRLPPRGDSYAQSPIQQGGPAPGQQRLSQQPPQLIVPPQPQPGAPSPNRYSGLPASPIQPPQQPPQQQQQVPPQQGSSQALVTPQRTVSRRRKVGLDDFNFLAVLGKGNFGKVMLAEEKKSNGLYAIKVLKKEFIIDNDEVESTRSEKRVFLSAAKERHPFLLGLHSCFQTETRVYFVMEYVSGGDLMLHIQRKQFSLRQAKFYGCEVLLALEYFHSQGIIYRDLKLDNILLTLDGHVKVADYGLCKEDMWFGNTTSTFCGTPEFMAPEILLEQRYGRAVDWWAFGVLMYEMLLGQSPFRGDDEDEIFDAILEDEPLYPITMPRDAVSVLQKLLTREPTRRLGAGKADAEEIKKHPFFKDVNWDDVFNKRIPPPYFPTINGTADTSNFDEEFTREQPTLTPVHGQLSSRDQAEFQGFSWVASWADT